MRMKGEEDVEALRAVVSGMNGDDPGVLESVVKCPEVFWPWWMVRWVRPLVLFGVTVGVAVVQCECC